MADLAPGSVMDTSWQLGSRWLVSPTVGLCDASPAVIQQDWAVWCVCVCVYAGTSNITGLSSEAPKECRHTEGSSGHKEELYKL